VVSEERSDHGATVRPDGAAMPFNFRLLGGFEVCCAGQPLCLPKFRKSQAVLALLALRSPASGYPGEVGREWLAGLLWPDSPSPPRYIICVTP
jgi:hypothetical protein